MTEYIFWKYITVYETGIGELKELWGIGRDVTPLWIWEEPGHELG